MKNLIKAVTLFLVVLFSVNAYSEELGIKMANLNIYPASGHKSSESSSGGGVAHKGMVVLQFDFNLGSHGTLGAWGWGPGYNRSNFVPGFTFNADFGVHDYVSVGPYIGFGGRSGYFQMAVGGRVIFHWWQLLDDKVSADLKSDKIDFYLPVHLGVMMDRFTGYYYPDGKNRAWHSSFNGGGGLGFRYYFVKQFGINLEFGWQEMSYAKLGFTFQLK